MCSLNVFGNVVDLGAVFVSHYSPLSRSGVCTQHYTILQINIIIHMNDQYTRS